MRPSQTPTRCFHHMLKRRCHASMNTCGWNRFQIMSLEINDVVLQWKVIIVLSRQWKTGSKSTVSHTEGEAEWLSSASAARRRLRLNKPADVTSHAEGETSHVIFLLIWNMTSACVQTLLQGLWSTQRGYLLCWNRCLSGTDVVLDFIRTCLLWCGNAHMTRTSLLLLIGGGGWL